LGRGESLKITRSAVPSLEIESAETTAEKIQDVSVCQKPPNKAVFRATLLYSKAF